MMSIIVIVKNDRRLEKLLNTLKEIKKPGKVEILVVDASEGRLNHIKYKFPKVKWLSYFSKQRYSIPEQRNLGLKKAKGNIIAFIDADCIPTSEWLVNLTKPLKDKNEFIAAGLIIPFKKFPGIWSLCYQDIKDNAYLSDAPTMNLAFKKILTKNVGYFDERFNFSCEDTDFCWRLIKKGYKIRYAKKAVVYHDYGGFKRNIKRFYHYGRMRRLLYSKHPWAWWKLNNVSLYSYCIYLLLLPVTILWIYYPLFLLIPIIKTIINRQPLEQVFFKTVYSSGFLAESLKSLFA